MVPYTTKTTRTTAGCSSCDTSIYDNQPYVDSFTFILKEEDLSLPLPKEKPKFERVMKMRNTDGRPIKHFLWKPIRMYNGRDNIGTRNFKKLN